MMESEKSNELIDLGQFKKQNQDQSQDNLEVKTLQEKVKTLEISPLKSKFPPVSNASVYSRVLDLSHNLDIVQKELGNQKQLTKQYKKEMEEQQKQFQEQLEQQKQQFQQQQQQFQQQMQHQQHDHIKQLHQQKENFLNKENETIVNNNGYSLLRGPKAAMAFAKRKAEYAARAVETAKEATAKASKVCKYSLSFISETYDSPLTPSKMFANQKYAFIILRGEKILEYH